MTINLELVVVKVVGGECVCEEVCVCEEMCV